MKVYILRIVRIYSGFDKDYDFGDDQTKQARTGER